MNIQRVNSQKSFKALIPVHGSKQEIKELVKVIMRASETRTPTKYNFEFKPVNLIGNIWLFATKNEAFGLRQMVLDAKNLNILPPSVAFTRFYNEQASFKKYFGNIKFPDYVEQASNLLSMHRSGKLNCEELMFVA